MRIKVLARSFFEARCGTAREAILFRRYRVISINNISLPAESPPFSSRFLSVSNLLILFFDDVEEGFPHAMTLKDAERIVRFILLPDFRPLLIHCTAGISRSGAAGAALNWYFNRTCLGEFLAFTHDNPDISPNRHVYELLRQQLAFLQNSF